MAVSEAQNVAVAGPRSKPPVKIGNRRLRLFGLVMVVLCTVSCVFTFLTMMGMTFLNPSHNVVVAAAVINFSLVLLLAGAISAEVYGLYRAKRRGYAGARLHLRMAGLFSLISAVPAVILAVSASLTLDLGLDRWFGERTKTIIENSQTVAQAYLREHGAVIRTDILAIARDIERLQDRILDDPQVRQNFLNQQAGLRRLPGVYIIEEDFSIVAQANVLEDYEFEPPPQAGIEGAKQGDLVFLSPGRRNLVGAILQLQIDRPLFLYITRPVNPEVMSYLRTTEEGVQEYRILEERRTGIQIAFALLYLMIAMVVLSVSTWIGIGFSNWLVSPLRQLIYAADQVSQGNFFVEVPVHKKQGDFASLGRSFNTMTDRLQKQRNALLETNSKLDQRNQFMEAVLSGVSAGVLGLDSRGVIRLANRSTLKILARERGEVIGKKLADILPDAWPLFDKARKQPYRRYVEAQVDLQTRDGTRNLTIKVTSETSQNVHHGYVVTIDDISDLVSAQRTSAWADVARRIAHEIKNPLTPIQLSAERIRRKYGKMIGDADREVFDQCTDTIVRQVEDIGRMVDEFSSFARMPKPQFEETDVADIVKQTVFLMKVGKDNIDFEVAVPQGRVMALCDRRLVSQALTNVIKNAAEAIDEKLKSVGKGVVRTRLAQKGSYIVIEVEDNGRGLPSEHRQRLLEPYMTTREKGTGLGLAIVRKIMEEHGGGIELKDSSLLNEEEKPGALIVLYMQSHMKPDHDPPQATGQPKAKTTTETVKTDGN